MNIFTCNYCQYKTIHAPNYKRHIATEKHKNAILDVEWELPAEVKNIVTLNYHCECCDYSTFLKSDYNRHISSKKHQVILSISKEENNIQSVEKKHQCNHCNKEFANHSGLWKHRDKCSQKTPTKDEVTELLTKENFMALMNQNTELKNILVEKTQQDNAVIRQLINEKNTMMEQHQQLIDIIKTQPPQQITNSNSNNNTTNNNQKFNLNFFLNETCKNALNFSDFINSIQVSLEDLENTGRLGYVDGISRIFINALKNTEVERRPLHCTDLKRETVYVKEEDKWEKERENLKRGITYIAGQNFRNLKTWKEEHPESLQPDTQECIELNHLYSTVLGGSGEQQEEVFENKIIHNVLKEVVVEK